MLPSKKNLETPKTEAVQPVIPVPNADDAPAKGAPAIPIP